MKTECCSFLEKKRIYSRQTRFFSNKTKKAFYRFRILRKTNYKESKDNGYLFNITTENNDKKIKDEQYSFLLFLDKFNEKHFQDFCYYFMFNKEIVEDIKNENFDYLNLDYKKTPEHIKNTFLSFNVKKANKGSLKNLNKLKCWNDDLSKLNEEELLKIISKEEQEEVEFELKNKNFTKNNQSKLRRSVYRWIIRGLDVKIAIKKELETFDKKKYFIKKNRIKIAITKSKQIKNSIYK